jgi:hypothetical protein
VERSEVSPAHAIGGETPLVSATLICRGVPGARCQPTRNAKPTRAAPLVETEHPKGTHSGRENAETPDAATMADPSICPLTGG